jgi:hypothetical protein
MIFTKAFTTFLLSTASSASLKGVIATANGLRLSEDSKPTADASSFTALMNGLQLHQDESEATKTSDKLLTILSNCLGETLELEKCYGEHEAVLTECVDCAWIDVLSGSSGIHCDNGIKDVCEENAATCASCLNNECGEKQASLLSCAVDLYCPVEEEEEEEEEDIEVSQYFANYLFILLYRMHNAAHLISSSMCTLSTSTLNSISRLWPSLTVVVMMDERAIQIMIG